MKTGPLSRTCTRLEKAGVLPRLGAVVCALWLLVPGTLSAQDFTVDWFAVAGGGGPSSGGNFELRATIGQPDTGEMAGGGFALLRGFWSIAGLIETPGAPSLSVSLARGSVLISWPENGSAGFVLEEAAALANP